MLSLDYRDARPIYEQVKDGLRRLMVIRGPARREKSSPPSVPWPALLAINPNTIQRAYEALEAEGYLCSVPGKGSFAAPNSGVDTGRRDALFQTFDQTAAELLFLGVNGEELWARIRASGRRRGTMIKVNNVVKTFEGFRALDGLTMTAEKGSIYGLVGPNGAGKSTILRHIIGVYRPDSGSVLVDGQPVYENPAVKAKIATIPDELYYFASASTRDMMRFYRGMYPQFDDKRYEALREAFPEVDEKQPIRRLSKGMQKQSAFWLALCCQPKVLVLDEPVDGLDPVMRRQVWSLLMGDVAQRGTTVLVSSHNLRELEDVCDHVGILSHGKVLLERSLTDLQDNMVKLQVAFQEPEPARSCPQDLNILHTSQIGRVFTLIVRGEPTRTSRPAMATLNPILMEALPLSLEEIFIYELGGEDYAVRDIVL